MPGQKAHVKMRAIASGIVPIIDHGQTAYGLSTCKPPWVRGNGLSKALGAHAWPAVLPYADYAIWQLGLGLRLFAH